MQKAQGSQGQESFIGNKCSDFYRNSTVHTKLQRLSNELHENKMVDHPTYHNTQGNF